MWHKTIWVIILLLKFSEANYLYLDTDYNSLRSDNNSPSWLDREQIAYRRSNEDVDQSSTMSYEITTATSGIEIQTQLDTNTPIQATIPLDKPTTNKPDEDTEIVLVSTLATVATNQQEMTSSNDDVVSQSPRKNMETETHDGSTTSFPPVVTLQSETEEETNKKALPVESSIAPIKATDGLGTNQKTEETSLSRFGKTDVQSTEETRTSEYIEETTTELTTVEKPAMLDLPALMDLILNLTGEFETNLTNRLNESLHRMSLPTCATPTFEPPTTSEYDANYTGSLVSKCFVCGLDVERVPIHAHCADAFAGDFLPLVPVDMTARAQISRYRKYCKYANNPGYAFNTTQPRAIFGRWTGGCAVRWIDLSGIYTQRVCRSRLNPTMGRHFASKRMAKLEKALWNVDNGCIVSPMATLVPLSRGISLYARFHACVCTGNWCNAAMAIEGKETITLASILSCVLFGWNKF